MTEYKTEKYTVRIHGTVDQQNIKDATEAFLKKVMMQQKKRVVKVS